MNKKDSLQLCPNLGQIELNEKNYIPQCAECPKDEIVLYVPSKDPIVGVKKKIRDWFQSKMSEVKYRSVTDDDYITKLVDDVITFIAMSTQKNLRFRCC